MSGHAIGKGGRASRLPRVLVVDNDATMTHVVERILGGRYETRTCTDAEEAIGLVLMGSKFDVILCDFLMPGLSGHDFYRKLLSLNAAMAARLVFITGAASVPEVREFLMSLSNPFLDKPFTSAALLDAVRDVVARSATQNAPRDV